MNRFMAIYMLFVTWTKSYQELLLQKKKKKTFRNFNLYHFNHVKCEKKKNQGCEIEARLILTQNLSN